MASVIYLPWSVAVYADGSTPVGEGASSRADASVPTIVITPQWRAMDPQQIPTTLNILSETELDAAGAGDTIDLQYRVPGMVLKTNTVLGQPYLRGVGSDIISAGAEASVATFVDGVYQARASGSIQDFFDVERVEVLKGPQGVHLGRNVVGGAISIITRDPAPYREGYADLLVGDYDKRQLRGAVNVPVGDSKWAFRLAGSVVERDGYTDNIFLDQDLDDEGLYAWRAKARYAPSKMFDVIFSAEHASEDSSRALGHQPDPDHGINGGILLGGTVPGNPRKVTHNVRDRVDAETQRYSVRLFRDLGRMHLRTITAWQESDISLAIDADGTDVDFSSNFPGENSKTFTQEVRLASLPGKTFEWVAGAYFLHEDANQFLDVRLPLAGVSNRAAGDVDTDAYALFGQIAYRFSEAWQGTAGLRYSYDRRKLDLVQTVADPFGAMGPAGTVVFTQQETGDWDAVTPELTVTYRPHSNAMIYAKASRGFKSGGFNTSAFQPAFDPEYLRAYEGGIKTSLPKLHTRLNAALFYYDYQDIQLLAVPVGAPPGSLPVVINAAEATVKGLDVETRSRVTRQLGLGLGVTLLNTRFDEFDAIDANNPTDDPDRSGDPLPQAPDISLNLSADYAWRIGHYGELTLRGEYRFQSSIYFNAFKDRALKQDGYDIVNASLSFESRKGRWYAELFGRNLTDTLYAQTIYRHDPVAGTLNFWGAPRTFGLRVGRRL